MVSTIIFGGLGNQLFIYASARALALRLGTCVVLNTVRGFSDDILFRRDFELDSFNVKYSSDKLATFDYWGGKVVRKISRFAGRNILLPSCLFLKDNTNNSDIDCRFFYETSKDVFLEGYWQSPAYFEDYAEIIRQDLKIVRPISNKAQRIEKEIFLNKNTTPVCVGIRRYQECTTPNMLGTIKIIGEDYYISAIKRMKSLIKNPIFYIFTQDKEWAKEVIVKRMGDEVRIVDNDGNSSVDDLYLMTKFNHHIISNSSFYWWGAWLADGEIVISTNSFVNKSCNCKGWIVI